MENIEKLNEIMMEFYQSGNESDIRIMYEAIEYLDPAQKRIYNLLRLMEIKYSLKDIKCVLDDFIEIEKQNRKSNKLRKMLEYSSLAKHFKGLKLSGNSGE